MGCENNRSRFVTELSLQTDRVHVARAEQFRNLNVDSDEEEDIKAIEVFSKENIRIQDAIKVVRLSGYKVSKH